MYHPDLTSPYGENWKMAVFSQSASSGEVTRDETDGINDSQEQSTTEIEDTFGLEFAAVQWLNLVTNAEKLFNNLLHSILLTGDEKEQIQRWLCLKQECEECVASDEATSHHRHSLERIDELTEDAEDISDENEKSTDSQYESDTESDFDSHFPDFEEKLDGYMDRFKDKTDMLIGSKLVEDDHIEEINETLNKSSNFSVKSTQMYQSARRNSLHPESKELPLSLLNSSRRKDFEDSDFSESYDDKKKGLNNLKLLAQACSSTKSSNSELKTLLVELESRRNKIKSISDSKDQSCKIILQLESIIKSKEKLISEIKRNKKVTLSARKKICKKKIDLERDYYEIKLQTAQAEYELQNTRDKEKADKLKETIEEFKKLGNKYEERLSNTNKTLHIAEEAEESAKRIRKIEEEIQHLKLDIEREVETKQKLEKKYVEYNKKIKNIKQKLNSQSFKVWNPKKEIVEIDRFKQIVEEIEKLATTKESSKKLQQLVQQVVGKEKQKNKMKNSKEDKSVDKSEEKDEKVHRNDIEDLRKIRTSVLDERSGPDEKCRRDRESSLMDDRKRLENDETIGAIDAVIEYKNELLSGRTSTESLERHKKEKGEQMLGLLDRLSKISPDEIRALLYYFFQKVIDLRDSGRKIEQQLYQLEKEYYELEKENEEKNYVIRRLECELQMQRHGAEQRIVAMKQNHQVEKYQLLKQIAEESGSSGTDTKKYLTFKEDLELREIREKKHRKGRSTDMQALYQAAAATMRIRNKSSSPDGKSSKALSVPSSSASTSRIMHEKNKIILRLEKKDEKRKK